MADPTLAAWFGVIVGAVLATVWPYYNATRSQPGTKFDAAYLASLVISVVLALPAAPVVFGLIVAWLEASAPTFVAYADNAWFVFALGVLLGAGFDRGFNERIVDKARG